MGSCLVSLSHIPPKDGLDRADCSRGTGGLRPGAQQTIFGKQCPEASLPLPAQGPLENVYKAALALGTANQLTNILRDVGEDVNERNRIYVPLEELDRFGIREADVRKQTGNSSPSAASDPLCFVL